MPLLITPPQPLVTASCLSVSSVYAIIERADYSRRGMLAKRLNVQVGYYASEQASLTGSVLDVAGLVENFSQEATPEEADAVPLFTFLEGLLRARLQAVLPEGTLFETVA